MSEEHNLIKDIEDTAERQTRTTEHILRLAVDGCNTDGAHHKQWYLEQIIGALGWNIEAVRGGSWEPGVAP